MTSEKNPQIYKCALCADTGYVLTKTPKGNDALAPCRCLMREAKRKYFGELFETKTLANYEGRNASMREAVRYLKTYPEKSFYIYGDVGLGKTHLLAAIFDNSYSSGKWLTSVVLTETQLIEQIKSGAIREKLSEMSTFYIDDIGKIKVANWDIEALFNFYNDIYRFEIGLVISSNYGLNDLAEIYGGAITRRIEERCEILKIERGENEKTVV